MDNHRQSGDRDDLRFKSRQSKKFANVFLLSCLAMGCLLIVCMLILKSNQRKSVNRLAELEAAEKGAVNENHLKDSETAATDQHRAEIIPVEANNQPVKPAGFLDGRAKACILIVRGIFTVFSLGMDDLAKKLQDRGYEVQVTTAAGSSHAARQLRNSIYRGPDKPPLIIIGHSLGGDLAPKLAQIFAEKNVPVDMLIMLDSTMPTSPPVNVRRCVNLYQSNITPDWARLFRGTNISAKSQHTELINIDIRKLAGREKTAGINHFNIDANPWIHDLIIEAVQQANPGTPPSVANPVGRAIPRPPVKNVRLTDQPILQPQRKFINPAPPGTHQLPTNQNRIER